MSVKIIEHDNGELSVVGNDQKYTSDFIRSLRVQFRSLLVFQRFYGSDKTMSQYIRGVCTLDPHEHLGVIGDPKNKSNSLNVHIDSISDDEYDRDGDHGEYGHTVHIGFSDFGEPTWTMWIGVTVTTFNHLTSEIRAGQVKSLSAYVKFFDLEGRAFKSNMYTDERYREERGAPWNPITWFLRPGKADGDVRAPEDARGIVESISWCGEEWCSTADEASELAEGEVSEARESTKTGIQLDKLLQHVDNLASSALAVHTTLKRLGWMALIFLTVNLLLKLKSSF